MSPKNFFNAVLQGAAITLGAFVMTKGIEVCRDPYKKANLKKRIKIVKNAITNKTES